MSLSVHAIAARPSCRLHTPNSPILVIHQSMCNIRIYICMCLHLSQVCLHLILCPPVCCCVLVILQMPMIPAAICRNLGHVSSVDLHAQGLPWPFFFFLAWFASLLQLFRPSMSYWSHAILLRTKYAGTATNDSIHMYVGIINSPPCLFDILLSDRTGLPKEAKLHKTMHVTGYVPGLINRYPDLGQVKVLIATYALPCTCL
jgi:hypothetical protein